MQLQSQIKVMKAGFTIIRCDDSPLPRIKYKAHEQIEWKTLEKHPSKAARDRRFKELLTDDNVIED
jgi:hypothetical protein